jgi:hypothetical protein
MVEAVLVDKPFISFTWNTPCSKAFSILAKEAWHIAKGLTIQRNKS